MKKLLFLFCLFLLPLTALVQGAFEERYWGARVSGLSGAYGIISNDGSGVFYNMATLSGADHRQMEFGYGQLFTGVNGLNLTVSNFGYAQPLKQGVLGIGWGSFSAKDLYREDILVVGYGINLKKLVDSLEHDIAFGITTRYLMRRFTLDSRTLGDPVFKEGRVNSNVALDLHFYIALNEVMEGFSGGLSLKSLNRPSVGYVEKEELLPEIVASIGWKGKRWTVPIDITHQGTITPHFGVELKVMENIVVRAGSDLSQVGSGFGYKHSLTHSIDASIDYSFLWPIHFQKGAGSHRTSIGIKF